MKKLKLNFQHLGNVEVLTASQMKQVLGGTGEVSEIGEGGGTRCVYYCCPDDGGPCSTGVSVTVNCSSNEECQSQNYGNQQCSIGYLAALCKG